MRKVQYAPSRSRLRSEPRALASGFLCLALGAATIPPGPITFTDVTQSAGIKFKHNSGRAGKKYLPETLGAGGAFIDYDSDTWPDILLLNGKDWTPRGRRAPPALYHNTHNGTFSAATVASGPDPAMTAPAAPLAA